MKLTDEVPMPVTVALTVTLLWAIGGAVPFVLFPSMEQRSQFGDVFGAINSLFAGLAFAGVIVAIALQRQELELQRRELELTRDELRRSAEAQELSQRALQAQVDTQMLTARLQALTSLLTHRSATAGRNVYADAVLKTAGRDADSYAGEIEQLLREISGPRNAG